MTDTSPAAVVDRRDDTLRALVSSPATTTGLADRLDVSRSTADRALRELATHGFVAPGADGYRPTLAGRVALTSHDQRARRIDGVADAATLFDGVNVGFDVDPAVFDGARVVEARPHAPNRPAECVVSLVSDATHVSVFSTRFLPRHARVYHDRVCDGMTGSFVATESVLERQRVARPDDQPEGIDLGRVSFRRTDCDDPVTLVLAETPDGPVVGLVVYRDETPRGFVGTDDPAATRWARTRYERLWDAATPLDYRRD